MISDFENFPSPQTARQRMRRTNKPMMEKKRRARINRSLQDLKQILLDSSHTSPSHGKWEKADILEMTVTYVRRLLQGNGDVRPPVLISARNASDSESGDFDGQQTNLSVDEPCSPSTTHSSATNSAPPSPPICQLALGTKRHRMGKVEEEPSQKVSSMTSNTYGNAIAASLANVASLASPVPVYASSILGQFAMQQHYEMLLKTYSLTTGAAPSVPFPATPLMSFSSVPTFLNLPHAMP
ncbi:unnamed protein product, partial [Mesorhabditis spiculigera]